ncbi:Polyketide cyclase / dehydrase and lipid transport [Nocardia farcinica]|uniref:Polyketide cyclase / dehydrase and lipid transport n=1 Tax=Nocardia farcinica TaxID=37329 RepID=A0A0H5NR84_NOCFR|nr:SRPBCC family protein [Nocardia farcinica]MBA4859207.1 SRPBCC family protein [Nocardia farcinica]MBC9819011.1 SRPBCC family protein [Nocardia farcinica]CRY77888.1 Polyketide cyclase / dehydrase and lipid transport [Nocardia farcinica]SIT34183.1 Polyketide cyclase / dehydrase and lipid transport [Nocardia farcinica]
MRRLIVFARSGLAAAALGVGAAAAVCILLRRGYDAASRFVVRPVWADRQEEYVLRRAALTVTVRRTIAAPPEAVFRALTDESCFSWLPLVSGFRYDDQRREVGAKRVLRTPLLAAREEITCYEEGVRIGHTITGMSLPLLTSGTEMFALEPGPDGGTQLRWTVSVTPRFIGWLPIRSAESLIRPVLGGILRGLDSAATWFDDYAAITATTQQREDTHR